MEGVTPKNLFGVSASIPFLLSINAILPAAAHAQAPLFITMWGTLGSGNEQFNPPSRAYVLQGHKADARSVLERLETPWKEAAPTIP